MVSATPGTSNNVLKRPISDLPDVQSLRLCPVNASLPYARSCTIDDLVPTPPANEAEQRVGTSKFTTEASGRRERPANFQCPHCPATFTARHNLRCQYQVVGSMERH